MLKTVLDESIELEPVFPFSVQNCAPSNLYRKGSKGYQTPEIQEFEKNL